MGIKSKRLRTRCRRVVLAALVMLVCGLPVLADVDESKSKVELPEGLEKFIKARMLESAGHYRDALELYAQALRENPEQHEAKVRYAALLTNMGLAESAVSVLEGLEDLDWFGLRTRAMALSRVAAQRPELLADAEEAIRATLVERANDPNMQLALAQVVHRQGRIAEAEELIADLRGDGTANEQLIAYHATLLRGLGRLDEAVHLYRLCIDNPLRGGMCRDNLVETLLELGRPGDAGQAMLEWIKEDDLDQMLRAASLLSQGGKTGEGLRVVRRVLVEQPDSPRARSFEALLLSNLGRYGEAAQRLRDLMRSDRENLDLILPLAWAEARSGRDEEARKLIRRAWELAGSDPGSAEAVRTCLAAARFELAAGRPVLAREWLERIPDPIQGGLDLVRMLAASYRQTEDWGDGVGAMLRLQPQLAGRARAEAVAYESELRLREGDSRGLRRLDVLLQAKEPDRILLGLNVLQVLERWSDVEEASTAALTRLPGQRDLLFARGAALERLGRADEAESTFRELLAAAPADADAANYLGYMLADQGNKLEEALQLIRVAVEAEPDNSAFLDSLGWVLFRLGDMAQAERWLRRALELGGNDGTVLAHLGEVLMARGEPDEASSLLRQALDLGCEHPDRVRGLLERSGEAR